MIKWSIHTFWFGRFFTLKTISFSTPLGISISSVRLKLGQYCQRLMWVNADEEYDDDEREAEICVNVW